MRTGSRKQLAVNRSGGKARPELRIFTPKASTPCLRAARRQKRASMGWVGNCGCTCLCPNPPK